MADDTTTDLPPDMTATDYTPSVPYDTTQAEPDQGTGTRLPDVPAPAPRVPRPAAPMPKVAPPVTAPPRPPPAAPAPSSSFLTPGRLLVGALLLGGGYAAWATTKGRR